MKTRIALILTVAALLPACDGHNVTPADIAGAAMNAIQSVGAPKGPQVGWTYAQVVAYQGRPERIYGHGGIILVYPQPKDLYEHIGISGLDNNSKVLWIQTVDNMNREVKT